MAALSLKDSGTREALRETGLLGRRKLARGQFTAVYDNEDGTVSKLGIDSLSFEGMRDYFHSPHLPKMLRNEGIVGDQRAGEHALYLCTTKKLAKLSQADAATRKLGRLVITRTGAFLHDAWMTAGVGLARGSKARKEAHIDASRKTLARLGNRADLPQGLRDAFADLYRMACDYDNLVIDIHSSNLLVDGPDHLILNDVIAPAEYVH